MINIICTLAKYALILLIAVYTYFCFSIFGYSEGIEKKRILKLQNIVTYLLQFTAFLVMYLQTKELKYIILYICMVILIATSSYLYRKIYTKVSKLVLNNMFMLLSIGFIIISRLTFDKAVKQLIIVAGSMAISLIIPIIIKKAKFLSSSKMINFYALVGIGSLLIVAILASASDGAKLGFSVGPLSVQPSEFVKIVFVFFVACSLAKATNFKHVVITTVIAAIHVLILVISTDLGAAVILFVVYLVMLYVGTKNVLYLISGVLAGSAASIIAYQIFGHVQTRVHAWQDPFANFDTGGYQLSQSLFAIGTGGWSGMGLFQGSPKSIPVVEEDFVFAAIAEEMGLIFALCVIFICISCYIMFLNIAMQIQNKFYKLVALGLGTSYIFQVFLIIGGVTRFIPSTGVTLPLISYGGSSALSTLIMFAIIQGLYILREDEEEEFERPREERIPRTRTTSQEVKKRRPIPHEEVGQKRRKRTRIQ